MSVHLSLISCAWQGGIATLEATPGGGDIGLDDCWHGMGQ